MISFKKIWNHFPFVIYVFVWFGIFVAGIFAPKEAVQVLKVILLLKDIIFLYIPVSLCFLLWSFMY